MTQSHNNSRVIAITGAAGNLGRAVARRFADQGNTLLLLDVDQAALDSAYGRDDAVGMTRKVNLLAPAEIGRAVGEALAAFGRIDVLCNLAGGFQMGPAVHDTPASLWTTMFDLNASTVINMAHAVVPAMLKAGGGHIVNVAAMGGVSGKANMAAYSVAKSAVIRLTEAMAAELRGQGIHVNCVLPSIIDTPQNRADMPDADPANWVAPEALADVIHFLASPQARALHGAAIPVVGLS